MLFVVSFCFFLFVFQDTTDDCFFSLFFLTANQIKKFRHIYCQLQWFSFMSNFHAVVQITFVCFIAHSIYLIHYTVTHSHFVHLLICMRVSMYTCQCVCVRESECERFKTNKRIAEHCQHNDRTFRSYEIETSLPKLYTQSMYKWKWQQQ